MPNPKELTRAEIIRTAQAFRSPRKIGKWTVVVEARELPARPLVLEAAGVPPNDPTNSHQAVAILEQLGFETRYQGKPTRISAPAGSEPMVVNESSSIADIFAAIADAIPITEWSKAPSDLSKNVDHHLYGSDQDE